MSSLPPRMAAEAPRVRRLARAPAMVRSRGRAPLRGLVARRGLEAATRRRSPRIPTCSFPTMWACRLAQRTIHPPPARTPARTWAPARVAGGNCAMGTASTAAVGAGALATRGRGAHGRWCVAEMRVRARRAQRADHWGRTAARRTSGRWCRRATVVGFSQPPICRTRACVATGRSARVGACSTRRPGPTIATAPTCSAGARHH